MRVVRTPARAVALFIRIFMLGSFMSLPMAALAAYEQAEQLAFTKRIYL